MGTTLLGNLQRLPLHWVWSCWVCSFSIPSAGCGYHSGLRSRSVFINDFVLLQISTIGYGDITPQQPAETAIALGVELLGVLIFGVLLGSITELLSRASRLSRRAALFRQKMVGVNDYMGKRKMPRKIRNRIKSYYAEVGPICSVQLLLTRELPYLMKLMYQRCPLRQHAPLRELAQVRSGELAMSVQKAGGAAAQFGLGTGTSAE